MQWKVGAEVEVGLLTFSSGTGRVAKDGEIRLSAGTTR